MLVSPRTPCEVKQLVAAGVVFKYADASEGGKPAVADR